MKRNSSNKSAKPKGVSINFSFIPRHDLIKTYNWKHLFFLSLLIYTLPSLFLYIFFHNPPVFLNEFTRLLIISLFIQIIASHIIFRIVRWFFQSGNIIKKFLISLFFLVVVIPMVVGIFSGIFFSLSKGQSSGTNETIDWKTYQNTKYGFSFKYPQQYSYKSSGPNYFQQQIDAGNQISGTVAPSYDTIEFAGSKNDQNFTIGIFGVSQGDFLQQGFDGSCGTQFADKTLIDKIDFLHGIEYREVEQQDNLGSNLHYCFLSGTNNLLSLNTYSVLSNNVNKVNQLLQQMFSTFKFSKTPVIYSTSKEAVVLVQDATKFWPTLGKGYYQLEINSSFHLFGKGNGFDLEKYLGKKIKISYREEIGHVEGEQQIVLVDSIIPDTTN